MADQPWSEWIVFSMAADALKGEHIWSLRVSA
jgi:hypothetical protein